MESFPSPMEPDASGQYPLFCTLVWGQPSFCLPSPQGSTSPRVPPGAYHRPGSISAGRALNERGLWATPLTARGSFASQWNSGQCLLSWCVLLGKTAGGTRCGDPGDISVLITDTTGERFCECSLAANGLCLERFLAQCSCAHESPSTPALSSKVYMLTFPRREDPGVNQILELLQIGYEPKNGRSLPNLSSRAGAWNPITACL